MIATWRKTVPLSSGEVPPLADRETRRRADCGIGILLGRNRLGRFRGSSTLMAPLTPLGMARRWRGPAGERSKGSLCRILGCILGRSRLGPLPIRPTSRLTPWRVPSAGSSCARLGAVIRQYCGTGPRPRPDSLILWRPGALSTEQLP